MNNPNGAVFLSYASEDGEAAARIAAALRAGGIEVWFDRSELRGGDAWDRQIRRQIHDCALFIAVISAHTDARTEGYFRREWRLAVERLGDRAEDAPFMLPVVIDRTGEASARVPEVFRQVHWTRLADGETPAAFVEQVARLLSLPAEAGAAATPASSHLGASAPVAAHGHAARAASRRGALAALGIGGLAALVGGYLLVERPWRSHDEAARQQTARAAQAPAALATAPAAPEKSIAVLPFLDMSEKKDQEYFSDGLSEELIDLLTQIPDLRVPARTSSFYFKGQHATLAEIARALNVSHVLEGSVRKAGNTLRITAQLVRADNGYHLWSQTFDRQTADIFKVQDEIAQAVVAALRVNLVGARPTGAAETENLTAHNLLLEGRFFQGRDTEGDPERAIDAYERALEADPAYALAWAELAWTLQWEWARQDFERTHQAALKAVELRPDLAQTHATLGWIEAQRTYEWAKAEAEYDKALSLEPSNMRALWGKGQLARVLKRPDESLRYYRAALERDPMSAPAAQGFSTTLMITGRMAEAEAQVRRALEIGPDIHTGYWYLGRVLLQKGDAPGALREMRLETSAVWRRYGVALAAYRAGQRAEADATLAEMLERDAHVFPVGIASVYASRGEAGPAMSWLERARAGHFGALSEISTDSVYNPIRGDARFIAFLRDMKLP